MKQTKYCEKQSKCRYTKVYKANLDKKAVLKILWQRFGIN